MAFDANFTTLTADERLAEAERILAIFAREDVYDQLNDRELGFVQGMCTPTSCSPSQLNWLRRINEKYL